MIKIEYLNGPRLYNPVPDGDTGTNMVFTLMPIITDLKNKIPERADETMSLIANTALESARGNSGTIIAQFYYGINKSFKGLESINVEQFAKGLRQGYESAVESLVNPEEGTIITVMRDVSDKALESVQDKTEDFVPFVKSIFIESEKSLKSTKTILKILKKSDVVDSGALGFVLLIQGVLNAVERGHGGRIQTTHLDISYQLEKIENLHRDKDFKIKNKFCTECVVTGDNISRKELKSKIKDFGDSMVIAGSQEKVKVHIHTNHPAKLFKMCSVYGNVIDKKVDDMTKQEKSIHHHGASSIAIVTDSGADLPDEYLKEIHVVPVKYSFGRQQHIDKVTQTVKEFYDQMASDPNHPKTSQPTSRDFIKMYDFVASHYNNIISLHLSSKLSGTYQSAINGSKATKANTINIIDSASASVGMGLLAMHAVDLKQEGKAYNQIIKEINHKKSETEIYLLLYDLSYAVKGGRVPQKVKTIANLFRLTPILTANKAGKLKAAGVLFGKSHVISKFSRFLDKKINSSYNYRMLIAHANCKSKGQNLERHILAKFPNISSNYLLELGGGLGAHAGPGALVIGLQKTNLD